MHDAIKKVYDFSSAVTYCARYLNWPIDMDFLDEPDDLSYDFSAEELGINSRYYASIKTIKQLRPLENNQPWGIFFVDFESKYLPVTVLRKIINSLVPKKKNREHKTWAYDNLLFWCFHGETACRTLSIIAILPQPEKIPQIRTLSCSPKLEDHSQLENFVSRLSYLSWPDSLDSSAWITTWGRTFASAWGEVVRSTQKLTELLAAKALEISSDLKNIYEAESAEGFAHKLLICFEKGMAISQSPKDFADVYAQTLVYGLLSARCMHPDADSFDMKTAFQYIPDTNPLLKTLLSKSCFTDNNLYFDELNLSDLIDILHNADIHSILQDFNRYTGNGKEDPVVYFYEQFLDIYEKEQKKRKGVYYTPAPVVDFMVRSVSELLKEKFDCLDGFASNKIAILDPSVGTGTFLRRIILEAKENFSNATDKKNTISWNEFVGNNLLKRLIGIEWMMPPYALAHMKLAMVLKETGYTFSRNERLKVFLADSLMPHDVVSATGSAGDIFLQEVTEASTVQNGQINIVIGNPPYHADSVNKGEWIMKLMEDYKREPNSSCKLKERNPKVINDDYVKFTRFAQEIVKDQDDAIIAYVMPHSYTDNLTFRGMRWQLLKNFSEIYILDLHGNLYGREQSANGERDENIFDSITQGICISFFIKRKNNSSDIAKVFHADFWGSRESKYHKLCTESLGSIFWKNIFPQAPHYFLKNKDIENKMVYTNGVSLNDLFPINIGGIKTHDDENLVSLSPFLTPYNQPYDYRPFDIRYINYDRSLVERDRFEVMHNFINHENLGLVINRQVVAGDKWSHIQIVRNMIDNRLHYSRKGIPVVAPMFIYDEKTGQRTANISLSVLEKFISAIGKEFSPFEQNSHKNCFSMRDLFCYSYAILSSDAYRLRYKDLLSIDFPRIPLPLNADVFFTIVDIGKRLINLHIGDDELDNSLGISFAGKGDNLIRDYRIEDNRLYINSTQYFTNVVPDIAFYHFGGYTGLQKWFKDRKKLKVRLSCDDINHVIRVFNIFAETEKIASDLDIIFSELGWV